jgi:hypothetical protein
MLVNRHALPALARWGLFLDPGVDVLILLRIAFLRRKSSELFPLPVEKIRNGSPA